MEPSPASSPRVSVPDSPSHTQAVLQLVGPADPPPAPPNPRSPSARPIAPSGRAAPLSPSSANWLPAMAADSASGAPPFFAAGSREVSKSGNAGRPGADSEGDTHSRTQENNSPECSSGGNPSPQGSCTGKSLCSENPSPRGSCIDSGACSSSIKGFDKKAVCVKPALMKKTGSAGVNPAMGTKKCGKVGSAGSTISVSHTEKETIVHTDCSNFREVVHQLTGASGNEEALLPVTTPSRVRGSVDDATGCLSKGPDLGPRRPTPTKLFERRRSSKTLERLTTSCRDLPPLVPSPVTPLASDFERICLPVTPVASPVGMQQEHNHLQMQQTSGRHQIGGNVHLYSSHSQPAIYTHANLTQVQPMSDQWSSALAGPHHGGYNSCSQQETSVEDFVIAEKGFFLHPQRPRTSEPALLSLFPESPRGQ